MPSASVIAAGTANMARQAANDFQQLVAEGDPANTKLVIASLGDRLRDEHVIADLVQRSIAGDNAFMSLLREVIREESDQILQVALAGMQEAA